MGLLILLQVALDLGFIAVATLLLIERSKSKNLEDARLSRGLQLLTSKIAILQDLMDRSETLSRQMTQILDSKQADIQERMEEVEIYLNKINRATEKSQEVAKIFQDRIPHQEIIERQNTIKYLQAAKMAHQGLSADDIARQIDLPRGELDLVIKLNRDKLLIENEPLWAQSVLEDTGGATVTASSAIAGAGAQGPTVTVSAEANLSAAGINSLLQDMAIAKSEVKSSEPDQGFDKIRPVIFKRINLNKELS